MKQNESTSRTRVQRYPQRGHYDRDTIYSIVDRALVCHVGFVVDNAPRVIPTLHVRIGDFLYIHGAVANQTLRTATAGGEICVTITHIDGLVLERSAFYHSINYRSVVVIGQARLVERERKLEVLRALVEHVIPGRWSAVRAPSREELAATSLMELPLSEASAKIRTGSPGDEEADYALSHWAGVIPLRLEAGSPIPDPKLNPAIGLPAHIKEYLIPDARSVPDKSRPNAR
ncbi:MAG TPA: pyridoxamine 5'-phosphate oxidase family protein [Candidatus Binataceae bacterium]|nr:pyridoxamine 5'-phosphate oxidase family protein [Candidatus Binataceae bacterium]